MGFVSQLTTGWPHIVMQLRPSMIRCPDPQRACFFCFWVHKCRAFCALGIPWALLIRFARRKTSKFATQ